MEGICTVVRVEGQKALLSFSRKEACIGCEGTCSGCGKTATAWVENTLEAAPGDRVRVSSGGSGFLGALAALFVLPFVLAFAALAAVGAVWHTAAPFVALGILLVSFSLAVWYLRRQKYSYIKMEEILPQA